MSTNAVTLNQVSKMFRLFASPRERGGFAWHPFSRKYRREFWALKNINLAVPKGKTLGVVGKNGSGKSTLLQVIAGIMQPSSGTVTAEGRISALLELGAGFNPDLTGRDNVLLAGALMGYSRKEITRRFPEIESFAEIGQFMDQPVKTYSSGMFLRLAFSAGINIEPDILIVDEILAVGDAKFQHKCFRKFAEFQASGKTIIFVSHDMQSIIKHCDEAVLLNDGLIHSQGKPHDVVNHYYDLLFSGDRENKQTSLPEMNAPCAKDDVPDDESLRDFIAQPSSDDTIQQRAGYHKNEYRFGDRRAEIVDYLIVSGCEKNTANISSTVPIQVYLKIRFHADIMFPLYGFLIRTIEGLALYGTNTRFKNVPVRAQAAGDVAIVRLSFPVELKTGDYFLDLGVAEMKSSEDVPLDIRNSLIHIQVRSPENFDGYLHMKAEITELPLTAAVRSMLPLPAK